MDPAVDDLDAGVTYARAAIALGCDVSTVRRMVKTRQLEAWRVTADPKHRGEPRVSVASIRALREARRVGADVAAAPKANVAPPTGRRLHAAHREAVAYLKSLGIG